MERRKLKLTITVIFSSLALLLILLFGWLYSSRAYWVGQQKRNIRNMTALPASSAGSGMYAAGFTGDLPLNRIQMIATHNSYHRQPDPLRMFFLGLFEPDEPPKLSYSHLPLTDQLDNGICSFELDVRVRSGKFIIAHVPLVDNLGPHPDFRRTLQELQIWCSNNPGHAPLIVILELKEDWMFLEPGLGEFTREDLANLDTVISEELGSLVYTPDDFRGSLPDMAAARESGWPSFNDLKNHIIFVLHTNDRIDPVYTSQGDTLSGRTMFTSSPPDALRKDAVFVIHNDPDPAVISSLVNQGYIVRTRADADLQYSDEWRRQALNSGAQIISTDFPPGEPNPDVPVLEFEPGKTIRSR